jgi:hypothetical protein
MDLRGCAAILLCEAIFSGHAGYWFRSAVRWASISTLNKDFHYG